MPWTPMPTYSDGHVLTGADVQQLVNNLNALSQWTSYTPTVTQASAVSKTINWAKYTWAGFVVDVRVYVTLTGAGTGNNTIFVSLPVQAATLGEDIGTGAAFDTSATSTYPAIAQIQTATTIALYRTSSNGVLAGFVGQDPNFALASGDIVRFSGRYESAQEAGS